MRGTANMAIPGSNSGTEILEDRSMVMGICGHIIVALHTCDNETVITGAETSGGIGKEWFSTYGCQAQTADGARHFEQDK